MRLKYNITWCALTFPLVSGIAALPPQTHVVHERRDLGRDEVWVKRHPVEAHHSVPVRIGLNQRNLNFGHDLLMEISDPNSSKYGHHYTLEEVIELFAPSNDTVNRTHAWIESSGIKSSRISLSANKQWIQFDAKVYELEQLLHTTFYKFEHRKSGDANIACDHYHVPEDLTSHIDFIRPGVHLASLDRRFEPSESKRRNRDVTTQRVRRGNIEENKVYKHSPKPKCLTTKEQSPVYRNLLTPDCLDKLYNITDSKHPLKKQPENSIGVIELWGSFYDIKALRKYLEVYRNITDNVFVKYLRVDGAPPIKGPSGVESDLDIQAVSLLAYPDTVVNYQIDDAYYEKRPLRGEYNNFLDAIDGSYCNFTAFGITGNSPKVDAAYPDPHKGGYKGKLQCGVYKPTKVISISWGTDEREFSSAYQRRQCIEFMKLGLQGVSTFVASGDAGVGCYRKDEEHFVPGTLESCPYVTAVGGTHVPLKSKPAPGVEEAVKSIFSGGGFSNVHLRPSYQEAALDYYFKHHEPGFDYYQNIDHDPKPTKKKGRYNRIGRGYPDVAAIADRWAVWSNDKHLKGAGPHGGTTVTGGTSLSAPLFGGMIARINNHRLAAGKSPVGFVNPALYANPQIFNDITKGVNNPHKLAGCGTYGFKCVPGWDPVTGLGSPNYGKMLEMFMALP